MEDLQVLQDCDFWQPSYTGTPRMCHPLAKVVSKAAAPSPYKAPRGDLLPERPLSEHQHQGNCLAGTSQKKGVCCACQPACSRCGTREALRSCAHHPPCSPTLAVPLWVKALPAAFPVAQQGHCRVWDGIWPAGRLQDQKAQLSLVARAAKGAAQKRAAAAPPLKITKGRAGLGGSSLPEVQLSAKNTRPLAEAPRDASGCCSCSDVGRLVSPCLFPPPSNHVNDKQEENQQIGSPPKKKGCLFFFSCKGGES